MIDRFDLEKCCGCSLCANICPVNAIQMKFNEKGFLYPQIDYNICINCELCEHNCSFNNTNLSNNILNTFFGRSKDIKTLKNSTSGGIFSVLSDYILDNNGIIIGALFEKNYKVVHDAAQTKEKRDMMRGSKYVQSDVRKSYGIIKKEISNRMILFVGTPCQVDAIKHFVELKFPKYKENLLTCDIICHGVPSPALWEEHINLIKREVKDVEYYLFRSKSSGWHNHLDEVILTNGQKYNSHEKNKLSYNIGKLTELFYKTLSFRESCSNCKYTCLNRVGDLTIADAWGIEKVNKKIDDNLGWSLILINTSTGKNFFEKVKKDMRYIDTNINELMQPQMKEPIKLNKNYNEFWENFSKFGAEYCFKKYTSYGFKNRLVQRLKKMIKRV